MSDLPHQELVLMLLEAWDMVVSKTGHTRKVMYRKVFRTLLGTNRTRSMWMYLKGSVLLALQLTSNKR